MPVNIINNENENTEEQFQTTPEEATELKPGIFNRKKLLIVICISLSLIVCGGLILNTLTSSSKKNSSSDEHEYSFRQTSSNEFLNTLQNQSLSRRLHDESQSNVSVSSDEEILQELPQPLLPPASIISGSQQQQHEQLIQQNQMQMQPHYQQSNSSPSAQPQSSQVQETHYRSSLVPLIQGGLFANNTRPQQVSSQSSSSIDRSNIEEYLLNSASRYSNIASQTANQTANNQQQNAFYDQSSGGFILSGTFIGENALWTGTIIPGVLLTAINTDLPGHVVARVSQNIFDSQTGSKLLIPQGTILIARYNSSVSYAQHRVQIVWDIMIRPDGYLVDLEGANAVDRSGMSGQAARYDENFFEYLKAAGIITLFSIANARMTESAAAHATESSAANIAEANSQLVNQLGGNLVSRAMNIQPTLTVENGTVINILLNKTIYLPPVPRYPASQRYILE